MMPQGAPRIHVEGRHSCPPLLLLLLIYLSNQPSICSPLRREALLLIGLGGTTTKAKSTATAADKSVRPTREFTLLRCFHPQISCRPRRCRLAETRSSRSP